MKHKAINYRGVIVVQTFNAIQELLLPKVAYAKPADAGVSLNRSCLESEGSR